MTKHWEELMAMVPLDFFRGFFDMIVAGRRDYALMTEALLVKPVKKSEKSNFLKYFVSPVNTEDGVILS